MIEFGVALKANVGAFGESVLPIAEGVHCDIVITLALEDEQRLFELERDGGWEVAAQVEPVAWRKRTVAQIIKFKDQKSRLEHLCAALRYLYFVYHGRHPDVLNPIFSGEVAHCQIQTVVFLD